MTIVCVCERVTREEIEAACDRGATTLVQLARACGAGTGCGECLPELRHILAARRETAAAEPAASAQ